MVKPLTFKGDKKPKKRKRTGAAAADTQDGPSTSSSTATDLRAAPSALNEATADDVTEEDDSWVSAELPSDVAGPIVIVLPSDPPTALSCDPAGKIFALELENMVEGNPGTAEPHDVRQVWVASRLSGSEGFRLKGHHGQYLSCGDGGANSVLSATADAVSPLESFQIIPTPEGEGPAGTFQIMTLRDTFISATDIDASGSKAREMEKVVKIRGDAETVSFSTTVRIRIQARFKPKIKASKQEKALAKISRQELETAAGRRLDEEEVRVLKRARREGNYHERLLDLKVKNKHDKWG